MKNILLTFVLLALVGCAGTPVTQRTSELFNDRMFKAPSERVDASKIFALSEPMRRYIKSDIAEQLNAKGRQRGLIDALYSKQHLKLDYDAEMTRTAAQTFDARAGNCLSLVIMTAAFAKELNLPIYYQRVSVEETWTRSGGIFFASNHVNVTLGRVNSDLRMGFRDDNWLTIDFFPQESTRRVLSWKLEEPTIVAMYFNNRAAEALARDKVDDAYWFAREAILSDPSFVSSYNTLGVVYRRNGLLREAELTLAQALALERSNLHVMSNMAIVLTAQGRLAEAAVYNEKVASLRPEPPFHFFNQGMAALRAGDAYTARNMFAKEVNRAPYNGEFHFWLGVAHSQLGEQSKARTELGQAMENSMTRSEHAIYAAKLNLLQSGPLQIKTVN